MEAPVLPTCNIFTIPSPVPLNSSTTRAIATCVKALMVQCPVDVAACQFSPSAKPAQQWTDESPSTVHESVCYSANNTTNYTLNCIALVPTAPTALIASSPPETTTNESSSPPSASVGPIVGGIIAGGLVILLGLLFFRRRRNNPAASSSNDHRRSPMYSPPMPPRSQPSRPPPSQTGLDYSNVRHLHRYLSTHPKLKSIWMHDVASCHPKLKTAPLKGAESTHVTATVLRRKIVLKGMAYLDATPSTRRAFVEGLVAVHGMTLCHKHLTTLHGMTLVDTTGGVLLCAATDFMDQGSIGSLLLNPKTAMDRRQLAAIAVAIAEAVAYLHDEHGVAFGILAPDKVLVDGSLVKLNVLTLLYPYYHGIRTTNLLSNAGSSLHLQFMAPELRKTHGKFTPEADVYALAVMLGFVFTRTLPYADLYHDKGLVRGDLHLLEYPDTAPYDLELVPDALRPTMRRALQVDPSRRPTASQLLRALAALPL
ncbi:hypothetical protein DYB30_010745 [Aphanomyces astaci]|uniref:Protein kinase domain-containing protein n=1 Tax=Aphanomyces astaci TaxID=112090 RepID=A0A397E660_APHAT|nr:hypothetical protein DYB30_010745 [Aphanomyces astaci]RHZ04691.1 hypothetical protein DYB26_005371 [Aphanomyces astaci]RHZ41461.1 hypothetical protein DYB31_004638 [Aphanomyces astaci]